MIELRVLWLFVGASMALLVTPGPAVLYILARTVDQGRRAGLMSAVGLGVGALVHVAAAATGLSALLATSPPAFRAVKLIGAGYLVYLGVRRLVDQEERDGPATPDAGDTMRRVFAQGVVVNVTNPKAAVFILAFLPQFVVPGRDEELQVVVLGSILVGLGLLTDALYALAGGLVRRRLLDRPGSRRVGRVVSGLVLVGLGVVGVAWPSG